MPKWILPRACRFDWEEEEYGQKKERTKETNNELWNSSKKALEQFSNCTGKEGNEMKDRE